MALQTLKKRSQFLRIRGGARWSTPAFVLEAKARESDARGAAPGAADGVSALESPQPRFGFTVTRKIGSAVVRNRVRRRLREAVRLLAPDHADSALDYVLIARDGAATCPFATLKADLMTAFARVRRPRRPKRPLGQR